MKQTIALWRLTLFCFAFLLFAFQSCREDSRYLAIVTVQDSSGVPISALVKIYCSEPLCTVVDSVQTGTEGQAFFEFDAPSILLVEVKTDTSIYEVGFIEVEAQCQPKQLLAVLPI